MLLENKLNQFSNDISEMDPIDAELHAIDLINQVENSNLKLENYKYLHFYASFNGLLTENGELKSEYKETDILNENSSNIEENNIVLTEATSKDSIKSKRERITKLVLESIALVDKAGNNVEFYTNFFKNMTDEQFKAYMNKLKNDKNENLYLELLPNKGEPSITDIEKLLAKLNIPKEEYVYYRDEGAKDDPIRTREKCSVGYVNVRRLQQILSKKNTYSLDIDNRDSKTGQVTGSDKIARISDSELYGLTVYKADHAIKEFYTARADNMVAKNDMYSKISKYGYVYLDEINTDNVNSQTLNLIDTYLLGAGIKSDLVNNDGKLAKDALARQVLDDELAKLNITKS